MVDIKNLKPKVQAMLGILIARTKKELGIDIICTQGYRSIAEQNAIYAQGRTKPGKRVTNAKGGSSLHNFGVAFDIVPLVNKQPKWNVPMSTWNAIAKIAKSIGLEWGDRGLVDIPHFQYMAGYSLADFQRNKIDWTKFK